MKKKETKDLLEILEEERVSVSIDESWERLDTYAPEARMFWDETIDKPDGKYADWWADKKHQVFLRAILYIGKIKKELFDLQEENKKLKEKLREQIDHTTSISDQYEHDSHYNPYRYGSID